MPWYDKCWNISVRVRVTKRQRFNIFDRSCKYYLRIQLSISSSFKFLHFCGLRLTLQHFSTPWMLVVWQRLFLLVNSGYDKGHFIMLTNGIKILMTLRNYQLSTCRSYPKALDYCERLAMWQKLKLISRECNWQGENVLMPLTTTER
jgi:hypothetical protein